MRTILSFFRALFHVRHIPSILIFLLNFWTLLAVVFNLTHSEEPAIVVSICALVTLLALGVVVSPVGDWWVLKSLDAKSVKVEKTDLAPRLVPLFNSVMSEARHKETDISENVHLMIVEDEGINAYAVGRRIVCLTRGAVDACDDETLRALLSHEFGHMAQRDSEVAMLICVGLIPLIVAQSMIRAFMFILADASADKENSLGSMFWSWGLKAMYYLLFGIPCWIIRMIIFLLRQIGSHAAENGADAFCVALGHGPALKDFMTAVSYSEPKGSLIDSIFSSHPASAKRVKHIEELLAVAE